MGSSSGPTGQIVRTERTVELGPRRIYCREFATEFGPSEPVPLVLLHGGGAGASGELAFARNVEALAAAGHLVIVPDLPGYGRSSKDLDQADPFGDLALAVGGLLTVLGHEKADIVGNSYGGSAALRLALGQPDRVARLVLIAPGGIRTSKSLPPKGLTALLNYYPGTGPSREKMQSFMREYLVFDPDRMPDDVIEARYQASLDPEVVANPPLRRPSGRGMLRTLRRMDFTRDRRRVARCTVPTLTIWGTHDRVTRPSGGSWLALTMPRCDLYMFADTAHWVQFEQADRVNELILAWLGNSHPQFPAKGR